MKKSRREGGFTKREMKWSDYLILAVAAQYDKAGEKMKSVKINTLKLKNFKGIKSYTLEAGGDNLKIYGQNATGKSTLFDAFLWLLFDKDSQNQKNFAIKTIEDGKEMPMLDHEVEASLSIDGTNVALKKIYREIWTKKRNSLHQEFGGHESVYFIDDVPKKKNEYTKFIENIVEEEVFKLLTSPTYFNESIKWQDRRKVLMRIAGEVSNTEIFNSSDKLRKLEGIMDGRKIDDFKAIQSAKKKKIKDEIEMIPVRVDEITLSIPEGSADTAAIEKEIAETETRIDELKNQISAIRSGGAIMKKRAELQEVKNGQSELKRTLESDSREEVYKLRTKIQEEEANVRILESKRDRIADEKRIFEKDVEGLTAKMDELRPQVVARKKEEYIKPESDSCDCPTCGQALPEDQIAAADEKAKAAFNLKKSEDVESMTRRGKAMKEDREAILIKIGVHSDSLAVLADDIAKKDKTVADLKERLKTAETGIKDASENKDYQNLSDTIAKLQSDISGLEEGAEESIASIQDEINELTSTKTTLAADFAKFANVPALKARIAQLQGQEEKLAQEYEQTEEHIFLIEEFIRAKVRVMEERINEKFKYARFKLFKTNVNGSIEETCETTYKGVEFSKGLNNAAKINVGLDIINTLSKFHELQAPIFVDNAEAVVNLINVESQVISLIVSGSDDKLRIERKEGAAV